MANVQKLAAKAASAVSEGDFEKAVERIIELTEVSEPQEAEEAYREFRGALASALLAHRALDREAATWICVADSVFSGYFSDSRHFLSMEAVNDAFEGLKTCDDTEVWYNVFYYAVCVTDSQMGLGLLSVQGCAEACRNRSDMIFEFAARFRERFASEYDEEGMDDMYDILVTGASYLKIAAEYIEAQWKSHTRRERFMADRLEQDEIEGRARRIYRAENSLFALLEADSDEARARIAGKMDSRLAKFAAECYAPLETLSPKRRKHLKKQYDAWMERCED